MADNTDEQRNTDDWDCNCTGTNAIWYIDVDIITARPPTLENTKTAHVILAHPADLWDHESCAHLTAIHMVWGTFKKISDMPVASRTITLEI